MDPRERALGGQLEHEALMGFGARGNAGGRQRFLRPQERVTSSPLDAQPAHDRLVARAAAVCIGDSQDASESQVTKLTSKTMLVTGAKQPTSSGACPMARGRRRPPELRRFPPMLPPFGAGCEEIGMRVVIGCGGAGSAPEARSWE